MHKAKHIEIKQLSDGAIAVKTRCCDDPSTDSWITVYVKPESTEEELQLSLDTHAAKIENQHEAMSLHMKTISRILSKTLIKEV